MVGDGGKHGDAGGDPTNGPGKPDDRSVHSPLVGDNVNVMPGEFRTGGNSRLPYFGASSSPAVGSSSLDDMSL